MKLQDMVIAATGNIQSKTEAEVSATDLLRTVAEPSELLARCRSAEKDLQRASGREARQITAPLAAQFSTIDRGTEVGCGSEIFSALLDFLDNKEYRSDLVRACNRAGNRLELAMLIFDQEGCYSFLEYVWEDDLQEKLVAFTGSSQKTVQGWLEGKTPSLYNQELLLAATTIFHQLCLECGMSPSEARRHFEDARFGYSRDKRLRHQSLWEWIAKDSRWLHKKIFFPDDLRNHIVSLGGDGEVFDQSFRHRFLF